MDDSEDKVIVIDNGSGVCKAGFAGEDWPQTSFPTIVGRPKHEVHDTGMGKLSCYIGADAQNRRNVLALQYPIERGIVTNWDDMEKVWGYLLETELKVTPQEYAMFLSDSPWSPKVDREMMVQIMFEKFNVRSFYVELGSILSMYSSGKTTGIVCDVGDGTTHVCPVYEGFGIPNAIAKLDMAGRDLTHFLSRMLLEKGVNLSTSAEQEIVRDIKEKLCYTALDYTQEMSDWRTSSALFEQRYELPDGEIIKIDSQRFRCSEALFQPKLVGREARGVHQMIHDSIMFSPLDSRKDLFANILLTGGSTMFPGFPDRIKKELGQMTRKVQIKIDASQNRKYSTWIGGSILASLSCYKGMWIDRGEYEESGPEIVHKKCSHGLVDQST